VDFRNVKGGDISLKSLSFDPIQYEMSACEFTEDTNIRVSMASKAETGELVTATVSINEQFDNYNYYIVDWGDGTWSYNGPYSPTVSGSVLHRYSKAGIYKARSLCMNMDGGQSLGWSKVVKIKVSGNNYFGSMITDVKAISSGAVSNEYKESNVLDNDNGTVFRSKSVSGIEDEVWAGLEFDSQYSLDTIEIKVASDTEIWPSNIAIEYTTDRGETWYSLPKYYYLYPYSDGRYNPIMNFPNPKGATLVLELDGIVANGIRICSKLFPLDSAQSDKYLEIAEMRVTGDTRQLFYTSKGESYDADINNMWTIYGSANTEPAVNGTLAGPNPDPFRTGSKLITSTEWLEWDGLQTLWRKNTGDIKTLYDNTLFGAGFGSDGWGNTGYVWATPDAPKHLDLQNHYTYNSIFIIASRNYILTDNDATDFFKEMNKTGLTMEYRIENAMDYMLTVLKGNSGVLTITDPDNDGTYEGDSSNYWDVIRAFGYQSAYENTLFYQAVLSMADIENYLGKSSQAKKYTELAEKVKIEFNKLFWDSEKGRYITSVDKNGNPIDFGMTYVNYMAVAAGLADEEQAEQIYSWVDGSRVIDGETSTGSDIYDAFTVSARSNTLDISSTGTPYLWWDHNGMMPCTPGTLGGYGNQMQNGVTIFYTSYYDIMGRLQSGNLESATSRFNTILDEFHKDQLRRFSYSALGGYMEGIIGEFPESGLVPLTFLTGFLGITPSEEGLEISANLPDDITYGGIREYQFSGETYSIKVTKELEKASAQKVGDIWFVELPAEKTWIITRNNQLLEK